MIYEYEIVWIGLIPTPQLIRIQDMTAKILIASNKCQSQEASGSILMLKLFVSEKTWADPISGQVIKPEAVHVTTPVLLSSLKTTL